ncbi:MAG: PAS-domain containing protein, partial [Devosiaceae bacterium]|nr:PAS-domain containing protein [Devosiaceae bacterium]
ILSLLREPAWLRNSTGEVIYANEAYLALCRKLNIESENDTLPEIFSSSQVQQHLSSIKNANGNSADMISNLNPNLSDDVELKISGIDGGSISILAPRYHTSTQNLAQGSDTPVSPFSDLTQVIDAMANPIAVFDSQARLTQFNSAYVDLFSFEKNWLTVGLNEREIIDYLRRHDLLPAVSDYRSWRTAHLASYELDQPRHQSWHLRDGRTLEVVATPDNKTQGVIYTFNDVTEQLRLQSSNKAMLNVQSETLNALSEGVAVFGTNGRLRLHNPRLSQIWKLPMNELGQNPHIDRIAAACGKSVPEDGEEIWQKLKLSVIDLDPGRHDKRGRIKRADGTLIDYTIVRLGDSQTMLTFVDVTQSANYENVLKERNDALVTADRLKDAFVQNVSYELRSPLTSIIGFADLLASDDIGPLTDKQRSYTDYIRSSSATLGVLIDNILDLTNVDAGIAQLDLNEQNIAQLIESAKAGFSATLVKSDGAAPLNLVVSLPDPQPRFIADGARVVQILYNLLSNAAKFSEPGAAIYLDVEANEEWVRFILRDQGVGIPQELQDAISNSNREQSLKGLQRGAGIGLLIVKAFVELHHGTLSMQPSGQGGSQIVVTLPTDASELIERSV